MTWSDIYLLCFLVGFSLSVLSFLAGAVHIHLPFKMHLPFHGGHAGGGHVGGHFGGNAAGHGHALGHAPSPAGKGATHTSTAAPSPSQSDPPEASRAPVRGYLEN